MNKKGYTLIEMLLVLALSSMLTYSVFLIPSTLYNGNVEYTKFADSISDNYHIRKVVSKDVAQGSITPINATNVKIGSHTYDFSEGVKRDSVKISNSNYSFTATKSTIKIFNGKVTMDYSVNSSFLRGENRVQ